MTKAMAKKSSELIIDAALTLANPWVALAVIAMLIVNTEVIGALTGILFAMEFANRRDNRAQLNDYDARIEEIEVVYNQRLKAFDERCRHFKRIDEQFMQSVLPMLFSDQFGKFR